MSRLEFASGNYGQTALNALTLLPGLRGLDHEARVIRRHVGRFKNRVLAYPLRVVVLLKDEIVDLRDGPLVVGDVEDPLRRGEEGSARSAAPVAGRHGVESETLEAAATIAERAEDEP